MAKPKFCGMCEAWFSRGAECPKCGFDLETITLTDQLAAYFEERPNEWIDGLELGRIAGVYAWRSRCSDLRKRGMEIQNKVERDADGKAVSLYCYVPPESKPVSKPPALQNCTSAALVHTPADLNRAKDGCLF